MHIAFVSLGAFGHINPTLALVTELVKRGVRASFSASAFLMIWSHSASACGIFSLRSLLALLMAVSLPCFAFSTFLNALKTSSVGGKAS